MADVQIDVLERVRLRLLWARIGGARQRIAMGAWAVYLPQAQMKLMHAVKGQVHCIYHRAPRRERVLAGKPIKERRATLAEWQAIYTTPVTRRVAENYVCLERLWRAGLGPEPQGLVIAPDYRAWFSRGQGVTAGYRVANLYEYQPKEPTTEQQLRDAGVIPDGTLATIREQINGYVSDLNSVHGAMPAEAEAEVAELAARLDAAMEAARR